MALSVAWGVQDGQMEKMVHHRGAAALQHSIPDLILGVFHSSASRNNGCLDLVLATVLLQVGSWTRDFERSLLVCTTVNTHKIPQPCHAGCPFPGLPPAAGRKSMSSFFLAQRSIQIRRPQGHGSSLDLHLL